MDQAESQPDSVVPLFELVSPAIRRLTVVRVSLTRPFVFTWGYACTSDDFFLFLRSVLLMIIPRYCQLRLFGIYDITVVKCPRPLHHRKKM